MSNDQQQGCTEIISEQSVQRWARVMIEIFFFWFRAVPLSSRSRAVATLREAIAGSEQVFDLWVSGDYEASPNLPDVDPDMLAMVIDTGFEQKIQ